VVVNILSFILLMASCLTAPGSPPDVSTKNYVINVANSPEDSLNWKFIGKSATSFTFQGIEYPVKHNGLDLIACGDLEAYSHNPNGRLFGSFIQLFKLSQNELLIFISVARSGLTYLMEYNLDRCETRELFAGICPAFDVPYEYKDSFNFCQGRLYYIDKVNLQIRANTTFIECHKLYYLDFNSNKHIYADEFSFVGFLDQGSPPIIREGNKEKKPEGWYECPY